MLIVDGLNHPNFGGSGDVGSLWGRPGMVHSSSHETEERASYMGP